mgnify:CR=1 FL=1|jgi:hypothetical protein
MSNTLDLKSSGFGIELEGFILGPDGKPLSRINGESSYLVLSRELSNPEWLSAELLSCQAEIKSKVHVSLNQAIKEIVLFRDVINFTLNRIFPGAYFSTIATCEMGHVELLAADPSAPSFERIKQWTQTSRGCEILRSTATCSMQLCVSEHFVGMSQNAKWLWLQKAFAYLSNNADSILSLNYTNRCEIGEKLIREVKYDNFVRAGLIDFFGLEGITRPNGMHLAKWYMAHSGVTNIEQMNSKDGHSILAKGKMIPGTTNVICIEYRFKDAIEDILQCAHAIYDVHEDLCLSV